MVASTWLPPTAFYLLLHLESGCYLVAVHLQLLSTFYSILNPVVTGGGRVHICGFAAQVAILNPVVTWWRSCASRVAARMWFCGSSRR